MPKTLALLLLAVAAAAEEPAAAPAPVPAAGRFEVSALDRSVDPCVDFYQFACGGWRAANPIPPDQVRWGRFNELAERNREDLHQILEKAKDASARRSALEAKVGDFYASCMDEAGIEALGTKPIAPALARIAALSSKRELFALLGEHEASGLPTLFRFGAAPDLHDSKQTIASLGQGGLGLPDRDDYLKDDAKSKEKRAKYEEHIARTLALLGDTPEAAAMGAATVMRLETALANAHLERVAMRDPKNRDNPMSLDELEKLTPAYDWDAYLARTGAPAFTRLNLTSRPYFEKTNAVVADTPLDDWKTYLRWHLARAASPMLGKAFVDADYRFFREYLQGAREIEPRYKRCVQATDDALGDALGQLYVEKTFGADGKARMKRMIEALTAAMREDIQGLSWMTAETKPRALAKLAAFGTDKVGYPDQWKDYSTVEVKRDDYLGNALRAEVFEIRRSFARIDKPTDRTLWGMTPPTVNAYYQAANNEIVFPAGILQPPFFDKGMDDAVNFGGIGVVIGHEYTHGFDDQGSKFDAVGQPGQLVDRRRPQGVRRAHGVHRQPVRRLRNGPGSGERGRAAERPAHARREHRRQRRRARRVPRAAEGARHGAASGDRRLHAGAALLPGLRWRLVPEHHRRRGAPAGADRPALLRALPRDRPAQQRSRVRPGLRLQGGPADGARERLPRLVRPGARRRA